MRLIQVRLGCDKTPCIVKYKCKEENTGAVWYKYYATHHHRM